MAGATIHHLAGTRPGTHPHAGVTTLAESADHKLDQVLETLTLLRVDVGKIAVRHDALASQADAHARDLDTVRAKHSADTRELWKAVDELRARPPGLTGKALLAGAGALVALAVGLVQLLTHVRIG